jgi:hypothetical protein
VVSEPGREVAASPASTVLPRASLQDGGAQQVESAIERNSRSQPTSGAERRPDAPLTDQLPCRRISSSGQWR